MINWNVSSDWVCEVRGRKIKADNTVDIRTPRKLTTEDYKYVVVCQVCGASYRMKNKPDSSRRTCSKSCAGKLSGKGEDNARWKGGRNITNQGYVTRIVDGKKRQEHRLVMEIVLGRPLMKNENIHHKNGDRTDNRPENLEVWIKPQPPGQRLGDVQHCPTCTCKQHVN